ncbi:hypothetical protein ACO0RG_003551 [Hanseniaspora osmophila]
MDKRGKLILIEGLDRTGKSTQCDYLHKVLLPGSQLFKFPNRNTAIGKIINEYLTSGSESTSEAAKLSDQAIHLLFSSNRWELQNTIKELLLHGTDVVLDRYVYSGIAYSMAKNIPGMDYSWCFNCDKGLIKPDLTIFFHNRSVEELSSRNDYGEEKYENKEFQETVFEKFMQVFVKHEQKTYQEKNLKMLDVKGKSIEQVSQMLQNVVDKFTLEHNENGNNDFLYFT